MLQFINEMLTNLVYAHIMYGEIDTTRNRLNKVLQLNLMFLVMHFVLYGSTKTILLGLHNPFADFIVVLGFVSLAGLWLCFDFFMPVLCEAVHRRDCDTIKPIGWMMAFSAFAFVGGAYQVAYAL